MKAIVYRQYGGADQLNMEEVEQPKPKANEVLIKVHATSLNASDMEGLTANPAYVRAWGLFKPKYKILGSDIAGTIVAIGKEVQQFKIGDEVFGDTMYRWGGFAEYVCATEKMLIKKNNNISFTEAAALPQSATIALQTLNSKRPIKPNDEILIIGAGGGSGTFAIQLAKQQGAIVTGVDNAKKLKMMKSLGADHVIDYQKEDPTKGNKKYDRIIAVVSPDSVFNYKKILKPNGIFLLTGGTIKRLFQTLIFGGLFSLFGNKKLGILAHEPMKDLEYLQNLVVEKKLKVVINKIYSLEHTAGAFQNLLDGAVLGKAVVGVLER